MKKKTIRIESVLTKTVDGKESSLPSTKFNCKYLAMSSIHLPRKLIENEKNKEATNSSMKFISRCVLITNKSIAIKNSVLKTGEENEEESSSSNEVNIKCYIYKKKFFFN